MPELQDVIIRDSDKRFRLRINGFVRSKGVSQIVGTKEYLEIEFIGGELIVTVVYPRKLEDLHESIKKELLVETELSRVQIDNIRFYVDEYIEVIEKTLESMNKS